jgi:hypothetical protein
MPFGTVGALRDAVRRKGIQMVGNRGNIFKSKQADRSPDMATLDQDEGDDETMSPTAATARRSSSRSSTRSSRVSSNDQQHSSSSIVAEDKPTSLTTFAPYVSPPEVAPPPRGGLLESVQVNVQSKMKDMLDMHMKECPCEDDPTIVARIFLSQSVSQADRVVIFIGDDSGAPAGIWSSKLCVRSGSEGIYPYMT